MKNSNTYFFIISLLTVSVFFCLCSIVVASPVYSLVQRDTSITDSTNQKDIVDLLHSILKTKTKVEEHRAKKKLKLSIAPFVGYTLSTGFAVGLSGIAAFYTTNSHKENESVINFQTLYDSHEQQTFITQSNIFTHLDQLKFVTDLRWSKYPTTTYGLGNKTTALRADSMVYNYFRLYQTVLKKITPNLYLGGGYCLDYHYNITEHSSLNHRASPYYRYSRNKKSYSYSSGLNLNFLFDTRTSPINPLGGAYVNIFGRYNLPFLGSDSRWSSIQIDARKYFKLSNHSKNVLAFWGYFWLSIAGKQPYFDLPSTGNDTYNNTGRGYVVDRFRGTNMLYLESEYRFGITKNGLLGAVVFANVQSFPNRILAPTRTFIPAAGAGLRIKMNKYSNTNLAIDYGVGIEGSHGIFVNLGEIF
ncbi:MAG: BamA/TamA family outer membrane protein [Sphingobacteriaceae bacterium]|nr:MAG: hypothetical protein E6Q66_09270 [Pedobacter sp.]